jgi:dinuclear metal center YbgI/SA1388 family protein
MKLPNDNVGLLVGDGSDVCNRVMLSLDITPEVVREAAEYGAQLIVSHHPVIRSGLTSVTSDSSEVVWRLGDFKIAAICMHTNLDAAFGGVNDELARVLGLADYEHNYGGNDHIGRVGTLPDPIALPDFAMRVKLALNANGVRYYDAGVPAQRVMVCGGSGADYCDPAVIRRLGFDTLVSADFKHGTWLTAKQYGVNAIDAGHYSTENVVIPVLRSWLIGEFPSLEILISEKHVQIEQYA